MKICFLITGLGVGGAEKFLLNLVPRLKFEKFVISFANSNDYGKELEKKGVKVYYLGTNKINLPMVIFKFKKIIKSEKPDIIDSYLIYANLFGRIFGKIFGIKRNISSIRSDYARFKLLRFLDMISQNYVNLFILNSKALHNYVHKQNHVPVKKIKILPNAIDIKKIYNKLDRNYDVRRELCIEKDRFLLVTVGRLIKDKNISSLIKAMKLVYEPLSLIIIGDGQQRRNLIKLTKRLNLNNKIFFLGKRNDVFNIINSSNVFILPSLREGMSNALLEAMTLKKVCIVSNIPQNTELIKDGFNGFIFNPKNIDELANVITKIYENKNLRNLGEKSFELIKRTYSIEKIIKKYETIVKNLFLINN
ncbi:MAG: glycosyltransferase [Promethearchaeota archaeon]